MPNVSEGRDSSVVDACAHAIEAAGAVLANRSSDAVHHRSVFTFFGSRETVRAAALALAAVTTERIDLRLHRGAHPRIGALDVLPFVPFGRATMDEAVALAREVARDIWEALSVPCVLYAEAATNDAQRLLADVRAGQFEGLTGAHPSAGKIAVGARPPLVAFNVVLATGDVALAREIARAIRERGGGLPTLRAIGIALDERRVQVSCNLTDHRVTPLHRVLGAVRTLAARANVTIERTELIGLAPRAALVAVAAHAFGIEVDRFPAQ